MKVKAVHVLFPFILLKMVTYKDGTIYNFKINNCKIVKGSVSILYQNKVSMSKLLIYFKCQYCTYCVCDFYCLHKKTCIYITTCLVKGKHSVFFTSINIFNPSKFNLFFFKTVTLKIETCDRTYIYISELK